MVYIHLNTMKNYICLENGHATFVQQFKVFLISNFRRVLNVVSFLVGNSPASEFYMPTFRKTLLRLHSRL